MTNTTERSVVPERSAQRAHVAIVRMNRPEFDADVGKSPMQR